MQTKKQLRERISELEREVAHLQEESHHQEETIDLLLDAHSDLKELREVASEMSKEVRRGRELVRELSKEVIALGGTVVDYTQESS